VRKAALALLVAGWALTLWVAPWSDERVNDLFVYRSFAQPLLDGALPYRDIAFEYPPLAVPAIGLPGLLGTGEESFRWAFALWTLAGGAAVVLLCGALARVTGGDARRAMFAAALMPLLCGALVRTHFDLFPVAILLGGLLLLCRDRPRLGLALLGLGAMTKLFPLVAVPVALAWLLGRGRRREAWQGALACAATIAVVAGAAVAVSPDGAADAVSYHLERPVQIESSPAMVLLGLDAVGVGDAVSVSSHRSDGLLHDASGAVSALFAGLLVGLVLLLAGRVGHTRRELVVASLAATIAFALLGKVLSPQFVIWALPLGALAFAWRRYALAAAVALAAILTQVEFPAHYFDVVAREPLALALVAVRNAVLLVALAFAIRELQPRRQEQLLDGRGAAVAVRLD
jgi:glycosyl transferase family 87